MADQNLRELVEDESQKVSGAGGASRLSSLTSKQVVLPVAATAAAAAAGLAAKKSPNLVKTLGQKGGELARKTATNGVSAGGSIVGKAASKLGGGEGSSKTRRLPIQRWTDVAVPIEKAYRAWIRFEEFPKFMHRVLDVRQDDGNRIHWREKIWFSTREWEGEITERRQNDRIAWKSVSGTHHSGVVSFHRLDKNLTRVLVTVDFVPTGMLEKLASGLRFAKRAVEADLARFKAYAELGDAKGLEYSASPEEMEQHRQDDEGGDDEQERGESDEQRNSERRERASRREERQKALSSS